MCKTYDWSLNTYRSFCERTFKYPKCEYMFYTVCVCWQLVNIDCTFVATLLGAYRSANFNNVSVYK